MTKLSWRERQKTFFVEKNIEFEQDQRIINWLVNTNTYVIGDEYFNKYFQRTNSVVDAEQALIFINRQTSSKYLAYKLTHFINIPRVCVAINKFVIYTDTNEDLNEDYDVALFDFIQSIFKNRTIEYYYVPNVKGSHFNFASPTTQFFIT
jgi:hypothetical protein